MNSISGLFGQYFEVDNLEGVDTVVSCAMGYLLRVRSSNELTHVIRQLVPDARVLDFRRDLQNAYYMRNVKLWIWRIISNRYDKRHARRIMPTFEVRPEDFEIARIVMRDQRLRSDLEAMAADFKSHHLCRYDRIIDEILDELHDYTARFAYRKLRFLTIGDSGREISDIITDLKASGLYAMRLQYPKVQRRLHLVNVCKGAIHNFGMNMIAQQTTQGRLGLLRQTDGSFRSRKVSIDSHPHFSDVVSARGHSHSQVGFNPLEEQTGLLTRLSVNKAIDNLNDAGRYFARLLTGEYNPDFSRWLGAEGYRESNDELLDYCLEDDTVNEYVELAADYCHMSDYRANIILNDIRHQLDAR